MASFLPTAGTSADIMDPPAGLYEGRTRLFVLDRDLSAAEPASWSVDDAFFSAKSGFEI